MTLSDQIAELERELEVLKSLTWWEKESLMGRRWDEVTEADKQREINAIVIMMLMERHGLSEVRFTEDEFLRMNSKWSHLETDPEADEISMCLKTARARK